MPILRPHRERLFVDILSVGEQTLARGANSNAWNRPLASCPVAKLARVSEGLVSTANGRVVFGEAVTRVADSLSPLGAAARIVAQSCALAVEMRELNLESRKIDNAKEVKLTKLADRRATSTAALDEMRTRLGNVEVTAQSLRQSLAHAQQQMVEQNIPHEDRVLYTQVVQTFGRLLVDHTAEARGALVGALDVVLNGPGSHRSVPVDAPPRRTAPGRSRRPRR